MGSNYQNVWLSYCFPEDSMTMVQWLVNIIIQTLTRYANNKTTINFQPLIVFGYFTTSYTLMQIRVLYSTKMLQK